jgi:hypothetical protein
LVLALGLIATAAGVSIGSTAFALILLPELVLVRLVTIAVRDRGSHSHAAGRWLTAGTRDGLGRDEKY